MTGKNAVERAEIAELIEEAWDTLKRLPDGEAKRLRMATLDWPDLVRRMWEDAPAGTKARRPPPTAKQIDRMYTALDWMLALAKQDRGFARAVWLTCAMRRSVAQVGKVLGVHRETARVYRDNGLDRIVTLRSRSMAA